MKNTAAVVNHGIYYLFPETFVTLLTVLTTSMYGVPIPQGQDQRHMLTLRAEQDYTLLSTELN